MNLEYLNTFIEVVKAGKLSTAAQKLYLSQPTVTFQIKKLEKELGYRLIERDTRNFLLTVNGKRLFRFAEYVSEEHRHLLSDMAQNEKGIAGRITIATTPVIGEYAVPNLISKFKEGSPAINVTVKIMDHQKVINTVTEHPDIIGFCGMVPESPDLNYINLGEDEMVLIVYPGHPFVIKKQVKIDDLLGETLILRAETAKKSRFYSRILKKAGLDLEIYQPQMSMGTSSGVLAAVEAKAGIGFISNLAIKNSEGMGMIKVIKIKNVKLTNQHYFIHNKNVSLNPLLASFIGFMNQYTFMPGDN
jgi:DNA-binding transcriptional LysR family regulator